MKEICIGRLFSGSSLLVPYYPSLEEQKDYPELMRKLGYPLNAQKKRGDAMGLIGTGGTLIKFCRVLFGLLRDDAYIGYCFQYLILHLNFRIHMLTPVILYFAFEVAG